jgi:hypothetical protein
MRVLDPPKLVVVHRDGRWCDGELHAWLRDPDGWVGDMRYATSPGCGTWNGSLAKRVAIVVMHSAATGRARTPRIW